MVWIISHLYSFASWWYTIYLVRLSSWWSKQIEHLNSELGTRWSFPMILNHLILSEFVYIRWIQAVEHRGSVWTFSMWGNTGIGNTFCASSICYDDRQARRLSDSFLVRNNFGPMYWIMRQLSLVSFRFVRSKRLIVYCTTIWSDFAALCCLRCRNVSMRENYKPIRYCAFIISGDHLRMTLQHLPELLRTALMSHQKHIINLWLTAISIRTILYVLCICLHLTRVALFMLVLDEFTCCLSNWSLLSKVIYNGLFDSLCIIHGIPMCRTIQAFAIHFITSPLSSQLSWMDETKLQIYNVRSKVFFAAVFDTVQ